MNLNEKLNKTVVILYFFTALISLYNAFKVHWAWIFVFIVFIFNGIVHLFKDGIKKQKMEICGNCGKTFKNLPQSEGGGDINSGYYCSEKCFENLLLEKYSKK